MHFAICKCDLRLVFFFQTTEFNQRKKINFEEKNRGKFVPQKGNVNLIVTRAFNTISHADQTKRYQTSLQNMSKLCEDKFSLRFHQFLTRVKLLSLGQEATQH